MFVALRIPGEGVGPLAAGLRWRCCAVAIVAVARSFLCALQWNQSLRQLCLVGKDDNDKLSRSWGLWKYRSKSVFLHARQYKYTIHSSAADT